MRHFLLPVALLFQSHVAHAVKEAPRDHATLQTDGIHGARDVPISRDARGVACYLYARNAQKGTRKTDGGYVVTTVKGERLREGSREFRQWVEKNGDKCGH